MNSQKPVGREADFAAHTRTHYLLLRLLRSQVSRRKRERDRRQQVRGPVDLDAAVLGFTAQTAAHGRFSERHSSSSNSALL